MKPLNRPLNAVLALLSLAASLACGSAAPLAPSIGTQPASQSVLEGAAATFTVVAAGTAPLNYQWTKGGVAISNATSASYTTPATVMADSAASFTVTVSNSAGSVTSSAATLTVNAAPPAITTQPASATVMEGSAAIFVVEATGTAPLSYQWKKDGIAISGANSASYTTPATALANSGSSYTVTVTNAVTAVTSNAAILTVQQAAAITTQPASQTVTAPAAATFTVAATGSPAPTYQWRRNLTPIAGATSASYTTSATGLADNNASYTVVVSNGAGSPVTSSAAILTVLVAPAITTQPAGATVTAGSAATFTVAASGNPAPTYQWKKGGVAIVGATSASYTTPVTALIDNASSFTVTVTNSLSSVTSNAVILTVQQAPVFTVQPAGTTVVAGSPVLFTASATGNPAPTFQWRKGATVLTGQTAATLNIPSAVLADAGSYSVTATNTLGSVTSAAAVLVVNQAPVITTQPLGQTIVSGQPVTFSVTATGFPALSYQWRKGGVDIPGAVSSSFTINAVAPADADSYVVVVSNGVGSPATSSIAILTVTVPPSITTQPVSQTVTAPATATFTVVATGTPAPSYQWRKGGTSIPGATSASFTTPATSLADNNASYTVVVSNGAGSPVTSSAAILTVLTAPAITSQPANQSVVAGQAAVFSVAATGNPAPTYQWRKGGGDIPGATFASYTTPATILGDSGSTFDVVLTNSVGTITSISVTLTVNPAPIVPAFTSQPVSATVNSGSPVSFSVAVSGVPTPTVQWQKNAVDIPGATSLTFNIAAAAPSDAGAYAAVATSTSGTATSNPATLTVNHAPIITAQPLSQTVSQGATVTFSVSANAVPSILTYQWRRNSAPINLATNSSLSLLNVSPADNGNYDVQVSNGIGTTTSSAAVLTVNPTLNVSGQVMLMNGGSGVPGVTVSIDTTPGPTTAITDSSGNFFLPNIPNGTYTLTPSVTGASALFFPASQPVTVSGASVFNVNFQASLSYTVSGTVSYAGAKPGRVFLSLDGGNMGQSAGVSIAAPGPFTIRGVSPGTYMLNAWKDALGQAMSNAADPAGSNASVVVGFGNLTGANVTLADPAPISVAGITPQLNGVAGQDGWAFVNWNQVRNGQFLEMADSYRIEWSTSNVFATVAGSATVQAMGNNDSMYFVPGLTNGTSYYFRVFAKAGATTSNPSNLFGPVIPAAGSGLNTVSGTVTFSGAATGPLYVGVFDQAIGRPYAVKIANPVSPQAFSISGVPNGNYFFFGIVDQNSDGLINLGDITNTNSSNASSLLDVTGNMTNQHLALASLNAVAALSTQHQLSSNGGLTSFENFAVQFNADRSLKLPVNMTLTVGTALFDAGRSSGGNDYSYFLNLGNSRPGIGDSYSMQLGYSDGSSEVFPLTVTTVLDCFPTNPTATPVPSNTTPTFSWSAPASPPPFYTYRLWVSPQNGGSVWQYPSKDEMPSSVTSVVYDLDGSASQPTLTPGTTYSWSITLTDGNRNSAQETVQYTP